jgi:hypothetical protein
MHWGENKKKKNIELVALGFKGNREQPKKKKNKFLLQLTLGFKDETESKHSHFQENRERN